MRKAVTIKLPDWIIDDYAESFTYSLRGDDFNKKLSKDDANLHGADLSNTDLRHSYMNGQRCVKKMQTELL